MGSNETANGILWSFAPILRGHDDVAPAYKLLGIIHDSDKLAHLLAATVDIVKLFVKACYYLEGDSPLGLHCYKSVEKLLASVYIGHMPNLNATVQSLTNVFINSFRVLVLKGLPT